LKTKFFAKTTLKQLSAKYLGKILKKSIGNTSLNLDNNDEYNFEGMVIIDDLNENNMKIANNIVELHISNHK
jgi:hypothetical protein